MSEIFRPFINTPVLISTAAQPVGSYTCVFYYYFSGSAAQRGLWPGYGFLSQAMAWLWPGYGLDMASSFTRFLEHTTTRHSR
jgi:hypothetical protein